MAWELHESKVQIQYEFIPGVGKQILMQKTPLIFSSLLEALEIQLPK